MKFLIVFLFTILLPIYHLKVVPKEDGSFEILDWNEYERGSREVTFIIIVTAGTAECFYEHILSSSTLFLSYEVVNGDPRTLDFTAYQEGEIFERKLSITQGTIEVAINKTSEWKFCYTNMWTRDRELYIFASFYHPEEIGPTMEEHNKKKEGKSKISQSTTNMLYNLQKVEENSIRLKQIVSETESHELVDTIAQLANQHTVFKWAAFQLLIILCVGFGQVYVIKYWFNQCGDKYATAKQNYPPYNLY